MLRMKIIPQHVSDWFSNVLQGEFTKRFTVRFSILCSPFSPLIVVHVRDKACGDKRFYEACFIDSCLRILTINRDNNRFIKCYSKCCPTKTVFLHRSHINNGLNYKLYNS